VSRIHVLVVDDDDDVRETLDLVLRQEGFDVSTAADGREALVEVERLPRPYVVLLDLRMPIMSGWEVIDTLRRQQRLNQVPIVICTSAPDDAPRGFPVVPKPVELAEIVEAIRAAAA
jgi:CheY-like chemotaxis protein